MNDTYYFSCRKFTVRVVTDSRGIIVEAAPIVRRFIGQPRANLTRRAEQYTGWKALPNPHVVKEMSHTEAAAFVAVWSGEGSFTTGSLLGDRFNFRRAYKLAARQCHPDATTGSQSLFVELQKAKRVLEQYHEARGALID